MQSTRIFTYLSTCLCVVAMTLTACATNANKSNSAGFSQVGKASYYADSLHGNTTASGEVFNQNALTAAHPKLAFGTRVKVTNTANGKSVVVRINDRGPFAHGRIIDLSKAAFQKIGSTRDGILKVKIETI